MTIQSRVLYQSDACIVVNKLKGEAVEGAHGKIVNLQRDLKTFLNTDFTEAVNRIDVPVTGCSLFALTADSNVFLNNAFAGKNGTVKKLYWAIVEKPSCHLLENGELIHWIETNSRNNKSYAYNESAVGRKKAVLRYRVTGEGINYLFIEVELLSGRHHQIRSQFAAAGLHIKGDLKYGAKRSEKTGGIRLHARYLSFPNPLNKSERISVTADPPEMDNLWKEFYSINPIRSFS